MPCFLCAPIQKQRNPYAPTVPCHRVVKTSRELGGFCGSTDQNSDLLKKKRRMLQEEGVLLDVSDKGILVNEKCIVEKF